MASLLRLVASPLATVCAGAFLFASAPGLAADCAVSPDRYLFEPTLPGLMERLSAGKPVTIVAIGGASTEGRAGGGPDYAWPGQLGAALKRNYPAVTITVVNLGKARQTAAAMQARFAKDVLPKKPNLVVWETGTSPIPCGKRRVSRNQVSRATKVNSFLNSSASRCLIVWASLSVIRPLSPNWSRLKSRCQSLAKSTKQSTSMTLSYLLKSAPGFA